MCFDFGDKLLGEETHSVTLFETFGSDVIPIYQRGFYFDGSDTLVAVGLILNTSFTLEYWIRTESPSGYLMEILKTSDEILVFGLNVESLQQTVAEVSFTDGQVNLEEWTQVVSVTDHVEFDLYINSVKITTTPVTLAETFIDLDTNDHVIGKDYTGFIYRICIYQYQFEPSVETGECDSDECVNCPAGQCIYECSKDQYYETSECQDCDDSCTDGCIRPTDCRNCLQTYCATCSLFDACETCITGASFGTSGECECNEGLQYQVDFDRCGECIIGCETCDTSTTCIICKDGYYLNDSEICIECHEYCSICYDGGNHSCTQCSDSNYRFPNTDTCKPYCPSGQALNSEENICDEGTESLCFDFSDKLLGEEVYSVSLEETTDVIPIFQRGFYFDGSDTIKAIGLVINTTFTLEYWIRAESSDGYLMEILET